MTATASEPTRLAYWLRRLWPLYCFLAALATFGYALFDPYQIDGDAVAYMDLGDLLRAHNWHAVINGYWNPLYPAALSLGHILFHPTRYTELHAYYMVNFGIFLLEMLAAVTFTDALIHLRERREAASSNLPHLLDRYTLRYLGIAILIIATQRELSMGKVRPDALLTAFLLFALAALLRHLATGYLRYAALIGLALGLGYLTKSFAFVFTLLCVLALVAFRLIWQKQSLARVAASALLVLVCFSIVAGPYIAALSRQKGRFDFGDSGNLNYVWFVSGTEKMHLEPDMTSSFGAAEVHLKHPETRLLKSPPTYSYKPFPYGTYPAWFDASYFNDQIKAHMNPHLEIIVLGQSFMRLLRYMANHPEAWVLLVLLLFAGARLRLDWKPTANAFWLMPVLIALAALCTYAIVNVEDRYLTAAFFALLLPIFAAMRISPKTENAEAHPPGTHILTTRTAASAAIVLLALLAIGESARIVGELRRSLVFAQSPTGWYNHDIFGAAHALNTLGVGPGDTVACIGTMACVYDHYWARLAGVRVLTEIYAPDPALYPSLAAMPNRDQAYDIARRQGAKVLIGYFLEPGLMTGTTPISANWHELAQTHFYFLPLNLPADTASAKPETAHP
ncbi:MAG: glycosyltransferase family 39 protein [Edaphobacter sp.]